MKRFLCAAIAVLMTLTVFVVSIPSAVEADSQTRYASKRINLFAKKSTSSDKLCVIPKGGEMTLVETSGAWANVMYEDEEDEKYTGFVKKANISKNPPVSDATPTPVPTEEPTPTPTPDPDETPDPDASPTPAPSPTMSPFKPGGGGYRPSGGGSYGSGSNSEQSITDQLGITPGKSLTSDHASGSYSSLAYGSVSLKFSSDSMTQLTLGSKTLDITLTSEGEAVAFTGSVDTMDEDTILSLHPAPVEEEMTWHMGGDALETLKKSGVKALLLGLDEGTAAYVTTDSLFSGVAYDAARASGVAISQIGLEIRFDTGSYKACAVVNGEKRELPYEDDKVFFAKGLTVLDEQPAAPETENAEV